MQIEILVTFWNLVTFCQKLENKARNQIEFFTVADVITKFALEVYDKSNNPIMFVKYSQCEYPDLVVYGSDEKVKIRR